MKSTKQTVFLLLIMLLVLNLNAQQKSATFFKKIKSQRIESNPLVEWKNFGTYEAGGVWKSTNNGKRWEKFFKAPYVWQTEVSPVNSDIITVNVPYQKGFKNPGLYVTQDGGKTWNKINKGIGQPDKMTDFKPDPYNENILWCAGWGSGWFKAILNKRI